MPPRMAALEVLAKVVLLLVEVVEVLVVRETRAEILEGGGFLPLLVILEQAPTIFLPTTPAAAAEGLPPPPTAAMPNGVAAGVAERAPLVRG